MHTRRITVISTLVLLVCLASSAVMVRQVDRLRAGSTLEDILFIPSSRVLQHLSLGYSPLLADIYWTRAVQYYGTKHHVHSTRYDLLAPLLEITTDLDPHLLVAYQFGSIFLSQPPPEGAGQPRQAAALVEKGIQANPTQWPLYFNLGWIQASELKDYAAAAATFARGAQVPGSNPALKALSATMAQRGGDIETARYLWTQMYLTTDNKLIRANAIKRLQALRVDEDVTRIEQALAQYRSLTGHDAASMAELQAAGWRGPTLDPLRHPYLIKPGGRVEVSDYDQLPFISKGLPEGQKPSLTTATPEQQAAIQAAETDNGHAAGPLVPSSPDAKGDHAEKPSQPTAKSKP